MNSKYLINALSEQRGDHKFEFTSRLWYISYYSNSRSQSVRPISRPPVVNPRGITSLTGQCPSYRCRALATSQLTEHVDEATRKSSWTLAYGTWNVGISKTLMSVRNIYELRVYELRAHTRSRGSTIPQPSALSLFKSSHPRLSLNIRCLQLSNTRQWSKVCIGIPVAGSCSQTRPRSTNGRHNLSNCDTHMFLGRAG